MIQIRKYIYFIVKSKNYFSNGDIYRRFYPGFYFADETEDLIGPYPSAFEAKANFKDYCEFYLGESNVT